MKPKDRINNALIRKKTDRTPICMWYHPETRKKLSLVLEIEPAGIDLVMGNDLLMTWVNNNYAMEGIVHRSEGMGHTDAWGIKWEKRGEFNQIVHHPLNNGEPGTILDYDFPWDHTDNLLSNMESISGSSDYFIGCDVSPCVFEMYWRLRGMEEAILDMAVNPELANEMFSRCASFAEHLGLKAADRFKMDLLWTGDDVAGKNGMIMSPELWREQIKPNLRQVILAGKQAGLPVAYHCCGAMHPIIGDLIELGVDLLNPVQSSCPGMNPADLKAEFGQYLTFMGGIDTEDILISGSPKEVRNYAENIIEIMTNDGGGYILAGTHTLAPETPLENIFALFLAAGLSKEKIYDKASDYRKKSRKKI
ncbi:MAG: uroporphyrinogen decarboxylase family protein [Spirochaetia bacterium]